MQAVPATPPRGDIEESMAAAPGDIEVSIAQLVKFTGCSREEAIAALKASNGNAHQAAADIMMSIVWD